MGAFWNRSSDSSSVVSRAGGGGGLAGGAWSWSPPSEGNGGLGGAIGSENIQQNMSNR